MLGVDKLDQLVSYYSFLHKSVKWWRKVFFWLLEVCVVNSFVIYKEACSKDTIRPMRQLQYRRKLIDEFTVPLRTMPSGRSGLRAPPLLERLQEKKHFLSRSDKRKDCVVCSDRSSGTRHLTHFYCETCTNHPPLCPTDCCKLYHTVKDYQK